MSSYIQRPVRFLIVEDQHLPMQKLQQLVVASKGDVTTTCRNLADFNRKKSSIDADIAIIDLHLGTETGNRDGWKVVEAIKASGRPIPIIICTSYNNVETWSGTSMFKYVTQMSKDSSLDDFLTTAYPLLFQFYPDAASMFTFHPGGNCPRSINDQASHKFYVKNAVLKYEQLIEPQYINFVENISSISKIRIYYQDQQIEFSSTLDNLLILAKYNRLHRISQGVIINENYLNGRTKTSVHIKFWGGVREFSISRNKKYDCGIDEWYPHMRSS